MIDLKGKYIVNIYYDVLVNKWLKGIGVLLMFGYVVLKKSFIKYYNGVLLKNMYLVLINKYVSFELLFLYFGYDVLKKIIEW